MPIKDPQILQERFQKANDMFARITPFEKIPVDIRSDLMAIFSGWSDAYEGSDWGASSAVGVARTAKWSEAEQNRWNDALVKAEKLVQQAAQSPGVRVLLNASEAKPAPGPIITPTEQKVTALVPWYWLVGSVAALVGLVAMLSKKEPMPKPVFTGLGGGARGKKRR